MLIEDIGPVQPVPTHVEKFREKTNGALSPEDCGYFGYQKYRNFYIFGKTQQIVEAYITNQQFELKNIDLSIKGILFYCAVLFFGITLKNIFIIFLVLCVSMLHGCLFLNAIMNANEKRRKLEDQIFIIKEEDDEDDDDD